MHLLCGILLGAVMWTNNILVRKAWVVIFVLATNMLIFIVMLARNFFQMVPNVVTWRVVIIIIIIVVIIVEWERLRTVDTADRISG